MSEFPNIDELTEIATDARNQCEKALRDAIPVGALVEPVDMIMRLLARSNRINEIIAQEYLPRRTGVLS